MYICVFANQSDQIDDIDDIESTLPDIDQKYDLKINKKSDVKNDQKLDMKIDKKPDLKNDPNVELPIYQQLIDMEFSPNYIQRALKLYWVYCI